MWIPSYFPLYGFSTDVLCWIVFALINTIRNADKVRTDFIHGLLAHEEVRERSWGQFKGEPDALKGWAPCPTCILRWHSATNAISHAINYNWLDLGSDG